MRPELRSICDTYFEIPENEGADKIMPLSEAIKTIVRPGMSIHFSFTHNRAHGAAYELARQYWGSDPGFTLLATGILEYGIILIYGGLVKKAVAAFYGDTYPSSGPNPILTKAFSDGTVSLENWTNLTIPLRFMAAAYNLPCIPTNSLRGSSMELENSHSFRVIKDPGAPAGEMGLLSPLYPDLTIIHGWAADRNGNTVILPPYGENVWGALASREGVLVTAEKIVSTDFIRRHSHFVKIPGHLVRAVSLVPFGGHPQGMANQGIPELNAYGDDNEFRLEFRQASRDAESLEGWINKWVLECRDHRDYLDRLGYDRLMTLKGKADSDSWLYDIESASEGISLGDEYTSSELMVIAASRIVREKVLARGYKNVLAGIGASSLAASTAYYQLRKKEGEDIDLLAETGFYGYAPRPGDPFVFNFANIPTSKSQSHFMDILNLFAGGNNNQCLGILATGQVDRHGNLNSTRLGNGRYLVGSGGSNDVTNGAEEVIVVLRQSKRRFVEEVAYVTSRGNRVRTVVSDLGVFEKPEGGEELVLTGCLQGEKKTSLEEKIGHIRESCGWDLKVSENVEEIGPPARDELLMIRLLDPRGDFIS